MFGRVTLVDSLKHRNTPAMCNRYTGDIFLSREVFEILPTEHKIFIILHEQGHIENNTKNEFLADEYAFKKYADAGYSLTKSISALSDVLSFKKPSHFNRLWEQYLRALQYDYHNNNNELAKQKLDEMVPKDKKASFSSQFMKKQATKELPTVIVGQQISGYDENYDGDNTCGYCLFVGQDEFCGLCSFLGLGKKAKEKRQERRKNIKKKFSNFRKKNIARRVEKRKRKEDEKQAQKQQLEAAISAAEVKETAAIEAETVQPDEPAVIEEVMEGDGSYCGDCSNCNFCSFAVCLRSATPPLIMD